MQRSELRQMAVEDLWHLHLEVIEMLDKKLEAQRGLVEERIRRLDRRSDAGALLSMHHRAYSRVLPKFRNPDRPSETWVGRGKRPRWLSQLLSAGRQLDDFRVREGRSVAVDVQSSNMLM